METLEGFPNLPAMVRAEQSSAAPHAVAPALFTNIGSCGQFDRRPWFV
jgi:hypothetical protein